ncbi:WD40 repeat domain-containing protein [Neobacillus niacini]|uniref:WD40 repeat domain-containing protein n=1 Tax=Neobacillus niacini TaxID=86668 RepID=UPI002FFD621E
MKRKKTTYIMFTVLFFLLFSSVVGSHPTNAEDNNVREIGTVLNSVSVPAADYGKGPSGQDWIYAVANGSPAVFNVLDAKTGERVDSFPLEGASGAWGVTVDPMGNVYIGTNSKASLFRYVPGAEHVENLGNPIPGESFIWRLKSDEDGRIYGGTFPSGKVFQYDPETNEFRDYGQIMEGQQYARSLAVYKDKLYVGLGTNGANLVEVDIHTGEKVEIPLPEKYAKGTNVYDIDVIRNKMFARVTGSSNTILVFDLKTKKIVDEIDGANGLDVSEPGPGNLVYFIKNEELYSYDLNSLKLTPTGFNNLFSARDFGWTKFENSQYPGKTLVSIAWDGKIRHYNPITGNQQIVQGQLSGQPVSIQSLTQGPNGNIFVGGYLSGGLAEFNYVTNQVTENKGLGQIEGMITHQNRLYMGIYPGGFLHSYDPKQSYEMGVNPVQHFSLKSEGQDRPFALESAGNLLAIGTVPDYGQLGGALTIFDPATNKYTLQRNIVEKQSVISLAYQDGLLYGGTSVWGGLGIAPTEDEAKLFIYNMETGEKEFETIPVPGEKAISALTFDKEGNLWGLTSGILFKYNTETNQVVATKELYSVNWDSIGHLWRGGFLEFDEDGYLYGQAHGELFRINPDTLDQEVLVDDANLFTMDPDGNIYFARGHKLYQYQR